MADLKGSKTEENLKAALAGESQARVKYEFYASQAKKDGYVEIKEIFQESSDNEKEHAKIWFKLLNGGGVPDTLTNLADAAAGENHEWTVMYKEFAETALTTLPHYSMQQVQPKRYTKKGTTHCPTKSKLTKYSRKMKKSHGNVTTADTSIMEKKLRKFVHYAITHKHTSENKILVTSRFFFSFFFFRNIYIIQLSNIY